jgi:hypothetical protein
MQISAETLVHGISYLTFSQMKTEKTEFSVLSVFIFRFSVFFGFVKTEVGIGFGFSKYRDIGSVFGIPTQDYSTRLVHHAVGSTPAISSQADSSQHCIKK